MPTQLNNLLSETALRLSDVLPKMSKLSASSPKERAAIAADPKFQKAMQMLTGKKLPGYEDITTALERRGFDRETARSYALLATGNDLRKRAASADTFSYSSDTSRPDPDDNYVESRNMGDVWRKLQREFKDWPLGELKDAASSVSPSMSPEARKVQVRYQELVKEYTKEESAANSGDDAEGKLQDNFGKEPLVTVSKAKYAEGMFLVRAPSTTTFKTRAARLAGDGLKGRYTNREKGYVMSPAKFEKFKKLYMDGWDASTVTGELERPKVGDAAESVQGSGHGQRLEEDKTFTTKTNILGRRGTNIQSGAVVTLSWKSASGVEQPSLTRVTDKSGNTIAVSTSRLSQVVRGVGKEPSAKMLEKWSDDGIAKSVLGAKVELDGWDDEGSPSWALAMGLI